MTYDDKVVLLGILTIIATLAAPFIYSAWNERNTLKLEGIAIIQYISNGGESPPNGFEVAKDSIGIVKFQHPEEVPAKEGYRFVGWLLDNDFYAIDAPRQNIAIGTERPLENTTFRYYAQWERKNPILYCQYTREELREQLKELGEQLSQIFQ